MILPEASNSSSFIIIGNWNDVLFGLGLFIALIFLQKYICKNFNIKLGLILPIIYLIPLVLIAIIVFFSIIFSILHFINKNITSNTNNAILTSGTNTFLIGIVHQIIVTIALLINSVIPALIHYLIYRYYKKKRK